MAAQREFQPPAERRAMERGHDRPAAGLDAGDDFGKPGRLGRLAEFANIRTGDEGPARAVQHDSLRARTLGLVQRADDPCTHGLRQRVHRRTVDGYDGQIVPGLYADNAHFLLRYSRYSRLKPAIFTPSHPVARWGAGGLARVRRRGALTPSGGPSRVSWGGQTVTS